MIDTPCWKCGARHVDADDCRGDFGGNTKCNYEGERDNERVATLGAENKRLTDALIIIRAWVEDYIAFETSAVAALARIDIEAEKALKGGSPDARD